MRYCDEATDSGHSSANGLGGVIVGVRRPKPPPGRYVYFIEGAGLVKIGLADDPYKRLMDLQTGSPVPLKLLGYYPSGTKTERNLHRRFASSRSHGEWFEADQDDLHEEIEKAAVHMASNEENANIPHGAS